MTDAPRSFLPVSGNVLPRFAGIPTFMRLPHIPLEDANAALGYVGAKVDRLRELVARMEGPDDVKLIPEYYRKSRERKGPAAVLVGLETA